MGWDLLDINQCCITKLQSLEGNMQVEHQHCQLLILGPMRYLHGKAGVNMNVLGGTGKMMTVLCCFLLQSFQSRR